MAERGPSDVVWDEMVQAFVPKRIGDGAELHLRLANLRRNPRDVLESQLNAVMPGIYPVRVAIIPERDAFEVRIRRDLITVREVPGEVLVDDAARAELVEWTADRTDDTLVALTPAQVRILNVALDALDVASGEGAGIRQVQSGESDNEMQELRLALSAHR